MKRALLALLLICAQAWAWAACDQTTVQAQISAASNGDTVTITPADCSASWNGLTISGKYITLDGNGANIERSGTSGQAVAITVNSGGLTRLTNFDFTEASDTGFPPESLVYVSNCTYSTGSPDSSFRIDNSTFDSDGITHIHVDCHGRGLIDNVTMTWTGNNEVIHVWGADDGGWTDDVAPGTNAAVYVEDSTFTNQQSGGFLGGKVAAFYGARVVYRFNNIDCAQIDVHGNTPRSGRWWELYHNSFLLGTCNNVDKWYQIRGGSGIIFGDDIEPGNLGAGDLLFWQDSGKTPSGQDHVGLGKDQVVDAAYVWDTEAGAPGIDDSACSGCIDANEDYFYETGSFNGTSGMGVGVIASRPATCTTGSGGVPGVGYWATDEGEWWAANAGADGRLYKCTATNTWTLAYTPYTYPHPLRSDGGGRPPAPTGLRVIGLQ